jgi:hypothetical protein
MSDDGLQSVAATGVDSDHPWPALDAFAESQSAFFCGRVSELDDLFQCVRRSVTTLLFGQSGLGKTSLVQAGLFPRLRQNGYLPVPLRLGFAPEAPPLVAQIKEALNHALDEATAGGRLKETARIAPDEALWEFLHRRDVALVDASGDQVLPVLCIDQFEQLFTLGLLSRRAECTAFLADLADLIENRPPAEVKARLQRSPERVSRFAFRREDFRIVLVLREDFLPSLEDLRAMAPSLDRNRLRLTPLKGENALEAVIGPGRERGIIGEAVAERIVRRVGKAEAGSLDQIEVDSSLLSLFCSELNKRRIASGLPRITAELVDQSSGDILDSFYEDALRGEPPGVRAFVEDQLVTRSGARDSVSRERAEGILSEQGVSPKAIDRLVARRLLRIHDRPEGPRVELIHDVLLPIASKASAERHAAAAKDRAQREAAAAKRKLVTTRRRATVIIGAAIAGIVYFVWSNDQLRQKNARLNEAYKTLQDQQNQLQHQQSQMDSYKDRATQYAANLPDAIGAVDRRSDTMATLQTGELDMAKANYADLKSQYVTLLEKDLDFVEQLRSLSPDDLSFMKAAAEIQAKMLELRSNDGEMRKRHGRTAIDLGVKMLRRAQEWQIEGCDLLLKGVKALAIDDAGRNEAIDRVHNASVDIGENETELAGFSQHGQMLRLACAALSRLEEAEVLAGQAKLESDDSRRTSDPDKLKDARSKLERALSRAEEAEHFLRRAAPAAAPQPLVVLRVDAQSHARRASLLLSESDTLAGEDAARRQGLIEQALSECEAAYKRREQARQANNTAEERQNLAMQAGWCSAMFAQQHNDAKAREYREREAALRGGPAESRPVDALEGAMALKDSKPTR